MLYIVNCDKLKFLKTFNSLDDALDFLLEENKRAFDGKPISFFGRGWSDEYYMDSAVLCPKNDRTEYFTFYIRCIDSKGELIELDAQE
jgi:hypothetical protein